MDPKVFAQQVGKMEKLGGDPRFYQLLLKIAELHARKNHDYAEEGDPLSNFRNVAKATGLTLFQVAHVFLKTKSERIEQLAKKGNMVKGESILDSLMDNAVYSLLAVILIEEDKKGLTSSKK